MITSSGRRLASGCLAIVGIAGSIALAQTPAVAPAAGARRLAPDAVRSIAHVRGNLYRAHNQGWTTVFYVTPAGIILGDPISEPFSTWLKSELSQRFPGRPVRYVVYSHSHFDHAEGAGVFADTAHLVAQENMLREMDGRIPQMPGDMLDKNQNGVFERERDSPAAVRHARRSAFRPQRRRHRHGRGVLRRRAAAGYRFTRIG